MSFRKFLSILFVLVVPISLYAQDSFNLKLNVQLNKKWDRFETNLKLEEKTGDCWLVRPTVAYNFTSWLKGNGEMDG